MSDPLRPHELEALAKLLRDREDATEDASWTGLDSETSKQLDLVMSQLDAAGRYERAGVADAVGAGRGIAAPAGRDIGAGRDIVASTLRQLAADRRVDAPSRLPIRLAAAIAAAAFIAAALGLHWLGTRTPDRGGISLLGPDDILITTPVDSGAWTGAVRWTSRLSAHHEFVIRVYSGGEDNLLADPVYTSPRITEPPWQFLPKDTSTWPRRIVLELTAYDAAGSVVAQQTVEAWR